MASRRKRKVEKEDSSDAEILEEEDVDDFESEASDDEPVVKPKPPPKAFARKPKSEPAPKRRVATQSSSSLSSTKQDEPAEDITSRELPFKSAKRRAEANNNNNKKKVWKSLRQILKAENYHLLPPGTLTYESINAPPSLLPAKKYCDITGKPAPYKHPRTGLRFCNKEVYNVVNSLADDAVQAYLSVRRPNPLLR